MGERRFLDIVKQASKTVLKWLPLLIPSIPVVVGYVSAFFKWGIKGPFPFLRENIDHFWLLVIAVVLVVLWIRISRVYRRFLNGFKDNFRGDLHSNWDFKGEWRLVQKGTLQVTRSGDGGLSKLGTYWENYTFAFQVYIQNRCLGAIVRAEGLNNYYMFQIWKDRIRPHRRVTVPMIEKKSQPQQETPDREIEVQAVGFALEWHVFDDIAVELDPPHTDWFDVGITVRGQSVSIHINNKLVFHKDLFLTIPTGKVGFRNSGKESALVRNVRVTLHP